MVISSNYKYIYIAVPKTGTSSISSYLMEHDPSAKRNQIVVSGKLISVPEHVTANRLKHIMGESFEEYKKVAFVRDPYSKLVSAYFFYKKGRASNRVTSRERRELKVRLAVLMAKLLPFSVWAIVYPYKSSSDYITDSDGTLLVQHIGVFESLGEEVSSIFGALGLDLTADKLHSRNVTEYDRANSYFSNPLVRRIVSYKVNKDLKLINQLRMRNSL